MNLHDLFVDPVTGVPLQPPSEALLARLQQLAADRALRRESTTLVGEPFEGAWIAADRQRAWLICQGVADFRPGAAVLLRPDDPP
ncbi:MAG: hypothetical protein FJ100_05030 [Deltaproteobacteria bacterium]|nr:hypothetical protein [Deltaproteobacteria bacterium]